MGVIATEKPTQAYLDLINEYPLRPIQSEGSHAAAYVVFHRLVDREDLTFDEQDYLDVLVGLIKDYEAPRYPVEPLPANEMLRHLMEFKGVSQVELSKATGVILSSISEILAGKRGMNVRIIEAFCAYFGVKPDLFMNRPEA